MMAFIIKSLGAINQENINGITNKNILLSIYMGCLLKFSFCVNSGFMQNYQR